MSETRDFDVVVVGASVAGCATARLFAQRGARVALIERRPDPCAYKVTCTHAIAPTANETIAALGLDRHLERRGAIRTTARFWTPFGGWFDLPGDYPRGWGVTRRTLDPLLRDLTASTAGVELFAGWTARAVTADDARIHGVMIEDRAHRAMRIRCRLVVGADGRRSTIARLAGVPGRRRPNNRFFYFAYWKGLGKIGSSLTLWLLDPDDVAAFPSEDDLTLVVASFHRSRLGEVRADLEGTYLRTLGALPDAPDFSSAERVSKIIGKLELHNVTRLASRPGLGFVGDAMLATDPAFAIGLTNAFQGAQWLVDATAGALDGGPALDAALRRYRRTFLWNVAPHQLLACDFSTGRNFRWIERRMFRAAPRDPAVACRFANILTRNGSPLQLLHPRFAQRLLLTRDLAGPAGSTA